MNMNKKSNKDFVLSKFILDVLIDVAVVIVLVLVFRTFLYAPFQVHGPSMCDTFNVYNGECYNGDGEYVITSRLSTWSVFGWSPGDIKRGDVVIFDAPYGDDGEYFIKRVIGLPGETLKIENGYVYLADEDGDFVKIEEESYLNQDNWGNTEPYRNLSEVFEVPEDEYFVLGDNRTRSSDSRRCFQQLGCDAESSNYLSHDLIQGEVKLVAFPLSHFRFVEGVDY